MNNDFLLHNPKTNVLGSNSWEWWLQPEKMGLLNPVMLSLPKGIGGWISNTVEVNKYIG